FIQQAPETRPVQRNGSAEGPRPSAKRKTNPPVGTTSVGITPAGGGAASGVFPFLPGVFLAGPSGAGQPSVHRGRSVHPHSCRRAAQRWGTGAHRLRRARVCCPSREHFCSYCLLPFMLERAGGQSRARLLTASHAIERERQRWVPCPPSAYSAGCGAASASPPGSTSPVSTSPVSTALAAAWPSASCCWAAHMAA